MAQDDKVAAGRNRKGYLMTHLPIAADKRQKIKEHILDISQACGERLEGEEIDFVALKRDGYSMECLKLEHPSGVFAYVEYPLLQGECRPDLHGEVFKYMREVLWISLRSRCEEIDPQSYAHLDGTINTIWNERLLRSRPNIACSKEAKDGDLAIGTRFGPEEAKTVVEGGGISIPHVLPDTLSAAGIRPVGDIVEMPHCGDDDIQRKFTEQYVFGVDITEDRTILRTSCCRHPVMGTQGVYPWREMRQLTRDTRVIPTSWDDLTKYDLEADIASYRRENAAFFARHGYPDAWYSPARKAA